MLLLLREGLEPLLGESGPQFEVEPGWRLRRRFGQCRHFADGRAARISIRCTVDGDPTRWRRRGALVHTLLHELAHLQHRGHTRAFWKLCRALLDEAASHGLYDPRDDDPAERSSGLDKLTGSAAQPLVKAARRARRLRTQTARELMGTWSVGARAQVRTPRVTLAVRILEKRRTRVLVQASGGRRYVVPVHLLEPA